MWTYEKKLQYPVNVTKKDLRMAKFINAQYGGPDGELAAALRYLNQRYNMPDDYGKALLTDIGTEELAHVEIINAILWQLTKDATVEELEAAGLGGHYTQHGKDLFPTDANGVPFTSAYFQALGDFKTNLTEDMDAEQKARSTYEHLIDLARDPAVIQPLLFLRQREVVHFNRFKQLLERYEKMGL
jgi:spore coat protein JC